MFVDFSFVCSLLPIAAYLEIGSLDKCDQVWLQKNKGVSCTTIAGYFLGSNHIFLSLVFAPTRKKITLPNAIRILVVACSVYISGALIALFPCEEHTSACQGGWEGGGLLWRSAFFATILAPFSECRIYIVVCF
jgi:hypothetical protein